VPSSGFLACSLEFSSNDILLCFAERLRRKEGRKGFEHLDFSHRKAVCVHLKELLGQPEREGGRGGGDGSQEKDGKELQVCRRCTVASTTGRETHSQDFTGGRVSSSPGTQFQLCHEHHEGRVSFFLCLLVCLLVCCNPPINQPHHGFYESLCSITVHVVEEDFLAS
jgi:hypothetical protein